MFRNWYASLLLLWLAAHFGCVGTEEPVQTAQSLDIYLSPGVLATVAEPEIAVGVHVFPPESGAFAGEERDFHCVALPGIGCEECEVASPSTSARIRHMTFRGLRSVWRNGVRYQPRADMPPIFEVTNGTLYYRMATYVQRWRQFGSYSYLARMTVYAGPGVTAKYQWTTQADGSVRFGIVTVPWTDRSGSLYVAQRDGSSTEASGDWLGWMTVRTVRPESVSGWGSPFGNFCQ